MWHNFVLFLSALTISDADLQKIGEKIWENESHCSIEKLVFWNPKEAFPSLGIGHFIWYHEKEQAPFEETFPKLIQFLNDHHAKVPAWLLADTRCPWKTREEFIAGASQKKIHELRTLLSTTTDLQTHFMVERFKESEKQLLQIAQNHEKIQTVLQQLSQTAQGLYALIDYTNFKGTGMSSKERYKNQGWGLLQVLEGMPGDSENLIKNFVSSAKKILALRVENAPSAQEKQWLSGWHQRLDTYNSFTK